MKKILILLILMVQLSACSSLPEQSSEMARLNADTWVKLPAPGLQESFTRHQLLSVETETGRQSFQALLTVHQQQMELLALTPSGIRLFSLRYDEQGIIIEQHIHHEHSPPAVQVLSDVMLAYWPQNNWHEVLPHGWMLENLAEQRRLLDDQGNPVVEIDYRLENNHREPYRLIHHHFGYQLHIRNLD